MRIAFVLHQFFPRHHTGTEQYARALAIEARRRGNEIVIFTFEPAYARTGRIRTIADDEFEGIPVRRAAFAPEVAANPVLADFDSPLMSAIFSKFLDEFAPEQIQFFHFLSVGSGVLAEAIARGIPHVVHATDFFAACPIATLTLPDGTACDGPPDSGFGCFSCIHSSVGELLQKERLGAEVRQIYQFTGAHALHRPLLGAMALGLAGRRERLTHEISRARAIAAPSRFLLNTLVKHGVAPAKLNYIPYGLDLGRLHNLKNRESGPVVFGYFGTIAPHKGVLALAQAFAAQSGDSRLVIRGRIGEFPQYGEKVMNLLKDNPRAEIRPPFRAEELGAALSEIDILIVPSIWHENTPFVALEAIAAGRPVIASERGGLVEIVRPELGGALFPAGDSVALAARLSEFSNRARVEASRTLLPPPRPISAAYDELDAILRG